MPAKLRHVWPLLHKLKARRVSSSLSVHFGELFCLANLANFELVKN
jgi:hypothetical protein